jgi:xanthine dehydrogenase small subunit
VPAAGLDGQEIVTVEGLGSPDDLHPVQRELAVRGGSQCGYCTPGFVCSLAAEYYRADRTTAGCDPHALSGNLCRCTGYRPIQDAADALGMPSDDDPFARRRRAAAPEAVPTRLTSATGSYARAADLHDALALLAEHPDAVLVAGSTDWGVDVNLRSARAAFVIGIDRVAELRGLEEHDEAVVIGAGLTLSEIEQRLGGRVPLLAELLPQFASRLIRNGASLGGNLATASPIGDAAPVLLALGADVTLASLSGERSVPLSDFFTGYRETVRRPDEVIRSVRIPLPLSPIAAFHKISKRRFDDISGVAVACAVDVRDGVITKARIGLGGVAATPIRALTTEGLLEGRPWSRSTVGEAARALRDEGTPMDDHRASAAYRRAMLGTALLRLHADHGEPSSTDGVRA